MSSSYSVAEYLTELRAIRSTGSATAETSFYPPLDRLFNAAGKKLKPSILFSTQLRNQGAGMPDGGFFPQPSRTRRNAEPPILQNPERGVVEIKPVDYSLDALTNEEQTTRYLRQYGLVLITNLREFRLLQLTPTGTPLAVEKYILAASPTTLWSAPLTSFARHTDLLPDFLARVMQYRAPLTQPKDVAWLLASYAREGRARAEDHPLGSFHTVKVALQESLGIQFEGEKGEHFFRSTLVQTLFYGIFSAWILWRRTPESRAPGARFDWRVSAHYLRVPVLRKLFGEVSDPGALNSIQLQEVLNLAGEALNRVQPAFFESFREDEAVAYFYEPFLESFDPDLRKELGVWYTPKEIVQYMVERVDQLLRTELDQPLGLASPAVRILDPCCGTGAYLTAVLNRIHRTLLDNAGDDTALVPSDLRTIALKADDSDPTAIGQFGTGFLTTHLLSKKVTVTGLMDDGQQFSFVLDRTGETAKALKDSMDESWTAFNNSLCSPNLKPGFTTSYDYPVDENVRGLVDTGLRSLMQNAAFLLAFNDRVASVRISAHGRSEELRKVPSLGRQQGQISIVAIEERDEDQHGRLRYVGALSEGDLTVAVELALVEMRWRVLPSSDRPRIFAAFPLTATDQFCLPIIINSEKLQPREDRDAVTLKGNRDGEHPNMGILNTACGLAAELAVLGASLDWENVSSLASVEPIQQWDWLDAEWFRQIIEVKFIGKLRTSPILTTLTNTKTAPLAAWLPLPFNTVPAEEIWDLASAIAGSDVHLPHRADASAWATIIKHWSSYLNKLPDEMDESLTLTKLCAKISGCGNLDGLRDLLHAEIDPFDFLSATYTAVTKSAAADLFSRFELIPNQFGSLKKITELRRDGGIDETLKDIAEQLGVAVRADIVHKGVGCQAIDDLKAKEQLEVVLAAVQKARERAQAKILSDSYANANVALFTWLVHNGRLDDLDGFPVLTRGTSADDPAILRLARASDEQPLPPVLQWPEPIRVIADLFPKTLTLADAYHESEPTPEFWLRISNAQYVRHSPLFIAQQKHIPFIPDEPIPVEKDKKLKHRTKNAVEVRAIAFFEKDDTGLDAVRRSKHRAASLLMFLGGYVLPANPDSLDRLAAECECGATHHYYKAAWLVPMWERQWVPLGDSKQSEANADAIARLFDKREEDLRELTRGEGRKLLEALGISMADLSLRAVASDEESRISLIASLTDILHAADDDPDRVRLLADELRESPDLLDVIHESRDRREKVRRNQAIGAAVEQLLKGLLEAHGLRVTRTGVGSDFEVESDFVEDDREILFTVDAHDRSYLIEIKSARTDRARMTVTQAKTAVAERCRFVLCLVKLDGVSEPTAAEVEAGCRFLFDIGDRIEPVWSDYARVEGAKAEASERHGDVELEMENAATRFAVSMKLWGKALLVEEAVQRFREAPLAPEGEPR